MNPRVTVVHDNTTFRDELVRALEQAGYEIIQFSESAFVTDPPRSSNRLEMAITQVAGPHHAGLRIRVTGSEPGAPYAGPLSWLFSERATVAEVMASLRRFGSSHP